MAGMAELKVTPAELRRSAADFKSKAAQIHSTTDKMLSEIRKMNGSVWSGDAADRFKAQFFRLEQDMSQMYRITKEYSEDLEKIAAQYEAAEQSNEAVIGALATDVIN